MLATVFFCSMTLSQTAFAETVLTPTALTQTIVSQRVDNPRPVEYELSAADKNPWTAMALNVIPFGVGSFRQGDNIGGTTIAVADGVAAVALVSMGVKVAQAMPGYAWITEFATALFALALGRVIGFIAPWIYVNAQSAAEAQIGQGVSFEGGAILSYRLTF